MPTNAGDASASTPIPEFRDILLQVNFDDPKKKQDKEYGKKLISRIYGEQNNQSTIFYYGARAIRWREVWSWAMGRQDMREFTDYLGVDGTKAYVNIDFTPPRVGPQFVETLVNAMAVNEEYPCVTAVDGDSIEEKEARKNAAIYRMHHVQDIDEMQQQTGLQLEAPNAYVPDDPLSAEVYFKLEDRLPKEVDFEEKLEKAMADNEYEILKRRLLRDLIVLNCAGTKIERLANGFVGIRKCIPANMIYNFFISDSGKMELSYIGEVYSLKVRDLRKQYGQSKTKPKGLTEKEIFEICQSANRFNVANRFFYTWTDNYLYSSDRPYDDYSVEVFDCELKVFDTDYYVSKTDAFGKENIQPKKGIPEPTSDKATVLSTNKYTVYRGVWAIKSDKMIYWGYPDVTIKPFMDISESLFSYTINIPNNDGEYVPSLFERAIEPLRLYALCGLRIKQLIAAMAPAGVTFDVERARDIDLGNGNILDLFAILKIRNQTGVVLWSSAGLNPNDRNERPPIEGVANAESVAQLTELNNQRQAAMQEIRSLLGVPLYRDGSDLPPRMGAAVVENQTTNSNNVTDFLKNAYHQVVQETLYKICLIKWDEAVIKNDRTDLMNTVFQVMVEMKPTAYEKQLIENNIAIWSKTIDGNGNPLLSPKDVFRIRQIKNFKLQDMYLASVVESNQRKAQQDKDKREQANIQAQQQTAMLSAQEAAKQQQEKISAEKDMLEFKSTKDKELATVNGLWAAIGKGLVSPDVAMPVIQQLIPNITIPLALENKNMQEGIQQQQMQEQMQQQQEMEPQEQPMQEPQMQ